MAPDVEIRGIFAFLYGLMLRARFAQRLLLCTDLLGKRAVVRLEFAANSFDVFLDNGKLGFGRDELFFGQSTRVFTAKPGADQFRAFIWQTAAANFNTGQLLIEIGWWWR